MTGVLAQLNRRRPRRQPISTWEPNVGLVLSCTLDLKSTQASLQPPILSYVPYFLISRTDHQLKGPERGNNIGMLSETWHRPPRIYLL